MQAAEPSSPDSTTEFHDPLAESFPASPEGKALFWLAVIFSLWQIAFAAHLLNPPSQVARAIHVGFLL
ncbi:MAG: hypothetical protein KDJ78_19595, partial [Rhodobacteraceae bacterium]|nr:hypothetical protein [Paracoccaceae bacterium]